MKSKIIGRNESLWKNSFKNSLKQSYIFSSPWRWHWLLFYQIVRTKGHQSFWNTFFWYQSTDYSCVPLFMHLTNPPLTTQYNKKIKSASLSLSLWSFSTESFTFWFISIFLLSVVMKNSCKLMHFYQSSPLSKEKGEKKRKTAFNKIKFIQFPFISIKSNKVICERFIRD